MRVVVQFFVIPDTYYGVAGYSFLLGLPWLFDLRGMFDVYHNTWYLRPPGYDEVILEGKQWKPLPPIRLVKCATRSENDETTEYDSGDEESSESSDDVVSSRRCMVVNATPDGKAEIMG
ncbi:hypothetical protein SAICODRAFT_9351 [Saitoella complicata NRRL Y-17804]|uniref:uncharacterized protein n=1 Tax=Saitoella complicata (strain BCRC 22490 / CBS 7301 / JCM 7358 / NBRC 10748 / NRRL Y-17804) TaxID=698492 RepID=UPI000867C3D6|nr:uncharacterized protein SAICODRAFT_9351 [Saitoella complicata NRRL Y-17804]ODQ51024.1 hypothetical protein SAICODRAFT_9351 [Saitoella complicata NRRL Y-17804]